MVTSERWDVYGGRRRRLLAIRCERCGVEAWKPIDRQIKPRFCSRHCSQQTIGDKRAAWDVREKEFWSHVDKADASGCWLWTGVKSTMGYGQFNVKNKHKFAHRISYEIANGAIQSGLNVLHHCDTPLQARASVRWGSAERKTLLQNLHAPSCIRSG